MIAVESLTVGYGDRVVVRDLSFRVSGGSVLSILGPSGCGKSTLLRAIAGHHPMIGGRVLTDDAEPRGPGPDRWIVFQESDQLFPWQRVGAAVAQPLRWRGGLTPEEREARVREALLALKLWEVRRARPSELSGGMRQRLAVARAIALRPPVLLLDEPFSAADYHLRRELQSLVRDAIASWRPATIFVTHDVREAIAVADEVLVLGGDGAPRLHARVAETDGTALRHRIVDALTL